MLLDRERVKFWQRWVFGLMALLMASFLVVGYSGALSTCGGGGGVSSTDAIDAQIKAAQGTVDASPKDPAAWIARGKAYMVRANAQTDNAAASNDTVEAITSYRTALTLLAKQKKKAALANVKELGQLFVAVSDFSDAVKVYEFLVSLQPRNADFYYTMGGYARAGGDNQTAFRAWSTYLSLDPKGPNAQFVRDALPSLVQQPSPAPIVTSVPSPSPTGSPK